MSGDVFLPWCARYLPMVVPPRPWNGVANGGYLTLPTTIMRHRDSRWQLQCAKRGEMEPVVQSLNMLADIPWVINRDVLNVVMTLWNNGGGFGDLPPRDDLALPEEPRVENYQMIADDADRLARYNADMDTYKKTLAKVRADSISSYFRIRIKPSAGLHLLARGFKLHARASAGRPCLSLPFPLGLRHAAVDPHLFFFYLMLVTGNTHNEFCCRLSRRTASSTRCAATRSTSSRSRKSSSTKKLFTFRTTWTFEAACTRSRRT